jgi:hypothetical protein
MRQEENSLEGLETLQKVVPFAPFATSYGMGWKGLQAVRYRESSADGEISTSSVPRMCFPWASGGRKS